MIRATSLPGGPPFTLNVSVSGPVVYLDNWAIGSLAEGDGTRRKRFIRAIHSGMDLLFSVANVVELSGLQGRSADMAKAFLNEIGDRWVPAELDIIAVVNRELAGADSISACLSEQFIRDYTAHLVRSFPPKSGKVISLSDFFCLGGVLDWVGPQRKSNKEGCGKFDEVLKDKLVGVADKSNHSRSWLDEWFPRIPYSPDRPAHFVYQNLLRTLIEEAHAMKANDAMDFSHAVIGSAYGSFATLDKHWKRRVENLPKPNGLARTYYAPQLDQMVTDMETLLATQPVENH